ncbi:hypothetical protein V8E53_004981 [Lactarius tabidus]
MENTGTSQTSMPLEDPTKTVVRSKKAQKRVLKMSKLEERKIERRAKEKLAKKEKKRKRAEKVAAGEQVSLAEDERSQKRATVHGTKQPFAARVVLDLGFDDKMSNKAHGLVAHSLAKRFTVKGPSLAIGRSANRWTKTVRQQAGQRCSAHLPGQRLSARLRSGKTRLPFKGELRLGF